MPRPPILEVLVAYHPGFAAVYCECGWSRQTSMHGVAVMAAVKQHAFETHMKRVEIYTEEEHADAV